MDAKKKSKQAPLARLPKATLVRRVLTLERKLDTKTHTIYELTTAGMEDDRLHAESMAALVDARNTWTKKAVELEEKLLAQQGFIDGLTAALPEFGVLFEAEHVCETAARLLGEYDATLRAVREDVRRIETALCGRELPDPGVSLADYMARLLQAIKDREVLTPRYYRTIPSDLPYNRSELVEADSAHAQRFTREVGR